MDLQDITPATSTVSDTYLDDVVEGWLACVEWTSVHYCWPGEPHNLCGVTGPDDNSSCVGHELDSLERGDWTPGALSTAREVCGAFLVTEVADRPGVTVAAVVKALDMRPDEVGHNLALSAAGHGTGFWDRGYGEAGGALDTVAETVGEYRAFLLPDLSLGLEGG